MNSSRAVKSKRSPRPRSGKRPSKRVRFSAEPRGITPTGVPVFAGATSHYQLGFHTRVDKEHGDVMVIKGSQRIGQMVGITTGTYGVFGVDLAPAFFSAASGSITTNNFMQALSECFERFRFRKFKVTVYGLGGTTAAGEFAMGYVADAGVVWITASGAGAGYSADSVGFNKISVLPSSCNGPAALPLSRDFTGDLGDQWCYTCRTVGYASAQTAIQTVERRLEDQGTVLVSAYNTSGSSQSYSIFVDYEVELAVLQSNVLTDNITMMPRRSLGTSHAAYEVTQQLPGHFVDAGEEEKGEPPLIPLVYRDEVRAPPVQKTASRSLTEQTQEGYVRVEPARGLLSPPMLGEGRR